jgi:hypothetical protein
MGKNWLIRTKSNHILGPISKEKVLDLYTNGSIKQDDEVCCGNGYWFFIRESSLVEKYLVGNGPQSFNPVSEAKDVLTASSGNVEYEPTRDDITMVGGIDLTKFNASKEATPIADEVKLEIPAAASQKKKVRSDSKAKQSTIPKTPKKQNYFRYIGFIAFLFLVLIIYFRKSILKSFFSSEVSYQISSSIFSDAHAQNESSTKKKNY